MDRCFSMEKGKGRQKGREGIRIRMTDWRLHGFIEADRQRCGSFGHAGNSVKNRHQMFAWWRRQDFPGELPVSLICHRGFMDIWQIPAGRSEA